MALVKVAVWGTVNRVVLFDTTISTRVAALESAVNALNNIANGGSGGASTNRHSKLRGLGADDHPQYTMWQDAERITGQWQWTKSLWGPDGTAAAPAFTFTADTNTGVYRLGADNIGVATGGTLRWDVNTSRVYISALPVYQVFAPSGVATYDVFAAWSSTHPGGFVMTMGDGGAPFADDNAPAFSMFSRGTFSEGSRSNTYGFGFQSLGHGTSSPSEFRFRRINNSTSSTIFTAYDDASQIGFVDGTAALPVVSFDSDLNTGLYRIGADNIGVSTGGTLRFDISTTVVTSTLPWRGPSGSATAPALSYSADTNTGMYRIGADDLGFTTGGTLRFDISTTAFTGTLPWQGQDGTAAAPAFSFSADTDTGLYRIGANNLGVATGGTLRWDVNTARVASTLPWYGPDGSNGTPTYTFTSESTLGFYRASAGIMGLAGNLWLLNATPKIRFYDSGSADAADYGFISDSGNGHYFSVHDESAGFDRTGFSLAYTGEITIGAANIASIAYGNATNYPAHTGYGVMTWNVNSTSTFTLAAGPFAALTGTDVIFRMRETDAAANAGWWRWRANGGQMVLITETDAGSATSNVFVIGRSGSAVASMAYGNSTDNPTQSFFGQLRVNDGSASAPTYSFTNDTNTGIYRITTDTLGIATNGTEWYRINSVGALGLGGATYGSSGSPLVSQGSGAVPQWGANISSPGNANFTVGVSGSGALSINASDGNTADFQMRQGDLNRWLFRKTGTAETGSNAGSDFAIVARDDAGASLGNALLITRSTGAGAWGFGSSSHFSMLFDNVQLRLGASADMYFYHDGTNSFVRTDTGSLMLNIGANTRFRVNSGGSYRGTGFTVATLPGSPTAGDEAFVTDALAPTVGATVAGGGAAYAKVWYNGTNWTVTGV